MSQPDLTIGALAIRTNTSVPTIRYYEEIGLLPRAQRSTNGRRRYRDTDLIRLTFIRRCRDLGFPSGKYANWAICWKTGIDRVSK